MNIIYINGVFVVIFKNWLSALLNINFGHFYDLLLHFVEKFCPVDSTLVSKVDFHLGHHEIAVKLCLCRFNILVQHNLGDIKEELSGLYIFPKSILLLMCYKEVTHPQ